jgi:hypothetical protein
LPASSPAACQDIRPPCSRCVTPPPATTPFLLLARWCCHG